ncbi:Ig-like domain-containing protein [Microvirga arabica]|uniref:Ig-like domain-containing protein n=1 Tax=Microvirga arabica TaxID=1128671 RepID=UPI00193A5960|nr:Ig-like domain-containing protein [Microvirga arabica]MBM1174715.1 cadherin-like domain-containing protein [Microvirga arabica]
MPGKDINEKWTGTTAQSDPNILPQATDDVLTVQENGLVTITTLLSNDRGGEAKTLYSVDSLNSKGVATISSDASSVLYDPGKAFDWVPADKTAQDVFYYTIRLANGALSTAKVTVTVTGTNDAPVVTSAVTGAATEDDAAVALNGLANASDVDQGDTLSVVAPTSLPAGVTLTGNTFSLDPKDAAYQSLAAGQSTTVTVNYNVTDGRATTAATASWTVTGTNDAPVVTSAVTGAATEDDAAVALNGLANASDVDQGDTLSVVAPTSLPAGVTLTGNTFSLDPKDAAYQSLAAGQSTTVTVNYNVTDGRATTAATASWTVTGTNDAPNAVSDAASTNEDTAITINAKSNDSDIDGDALTITSLSGATSTMGAAISINADGNIVYNPAGSATLQSMNNGQSKTDTFSYTVSDGQGGSATSTVSVLVSGSNDGPTAAPDTASTDEDTSININVLSNDSAGSTITGIVAPNGTISPFTTSEKGAYVEVKNGQLLYNPSSSGTLQNLNAGENTTDTFQYQIRDASGNVSSATVSISVAGRAEASIINSGVQSTVDFNSAAVNSAPSSYSEDGMTVKSLYSGGGHLHFYNQYGDSSISTGIEIQNHDGCCSTPYEFRYHNASNGDKTFSLLSFNNVAGDGVWTSSKGGAHTVSSTGTIDLSSNAAFRDVEWVLWSSPDGGSGSNYVDNLVFSA